MPTVVDRERPDSTTEFEFVMSFIDESDKMREEFIDMMHECMSNYMVNPFEDRSLRDKDFPLATSIGYNRGYDSGYYGARGGYSVLKDSESHQIVESLLAGTLLSVMGDPGYIQSRRAGIEDTFKASTVSRLLEYDLNLPGVFREFYLWLKSGFIMGTGIQRILWDFQEEPVKRRGFDTLGNEELADFETGMGVMYDDPRFEAISLMDFYPDPGEPILRRQRGCAERFRMTAREALRQAELGIFDKRMVMAAIDSQKGKGDPREEDENAMWEGVDRPLNRRKHPDFIELIGYQYWGEVPWNPKSTQQDPEADDWRRIVILGGENVSSRSWPLLHRRLPFFDFTVSPMPDRFYGVSPLEVSRYSQDLADVLTCMIADGAIRTTHPQPIVQRDSMIKPAAFQNFKPNNPIMSAVRNGAEYLKYDPNLQQALAVLQGTKQSMRERSAATDVEQGLGFSGGVPRSASAAAIESERAKTRPELVATLVERDALPEIGQHLLRLNQQFLEDSADLQKRVGEVPVPFPIEQILGDHDVRFMGSRQTTSKEQRVANTERAFSVLGQLPVAPLLPWIEMAGKYLGDLDMDEIQAQIADPQSTLLYTIMARLVAGGAGGGGAQGNGVAEEPGPSGLAPAQVSGQGPTFG